MFELLKPAAVGQPSQAHSSELLHLPQSSAGDVLSLGEAALLLSALASLAISLGLTGSIF